MKKMILWSLFASSFTCIFSNDDLHRRIELTSKNLQVKIQDAIAKLQDKIDNKICENEEDRLDLVFQFIYQWRTDHVKVFQPVVLQQQEGEDSYMHALKNIMYITSILGTDSIERMQTQAQHLINKKTIEQFTSQYKNTPINMIVITPEHKKISTIARCPVTSYDLQSKDFKNSIEFIKNNEHCCASFIVKKNQHHFAIITYKTEGTIYYIIADSKNETHFNDESLTKLIQLLKEKEE